ncbi:SAM-dependent methyltransferase [Candidatus Mycobacterium methanotrophicum]|uniref:Cyclopropane-fatty-acyl-phospholipid synthase family protein n=1 Tax=Candidatus Mycobacterium methanotrophicum TaxID=2943498 RepID=A0ABY4QFS7_9MYCO|nr:cyclopropane-fatty-acyl-phospholipid synthase family protein [Candidatus Mycobacterium methanotrophicum]UQX09674.1 cyclopropane-fatty-acyl-phospholipid synthase family protein [Candidatus Mycobacterium methanotrophicum]
MTSISERGASAESIQHHYDVSERFYSLWLDESMTYSCGLWQNDDDCLSAAQTRKIDYLVSLAGAGGRERVLDIGCGWGSVMQRLVAEHGVEHVTGLTLSAAQARRIEDLRDPRLEVRVQDWADFVPDAPYDTAISVGAMEHFVKFGWERSKKVAAYRRFFEKCHESLKSGAGMALQTIGKGNVVLDAQGLRDTIFMAQHIFPESDPPRLAEILHATEKLFEVQSVVNHREHYARTCSAWLEKLQAHRTEAGEIVGPEKAEIYEKYLKASIRQFRLGHANLYRISLCRV